MSRKAIAILAVALTMIAGCEPAKKPGEKADGGGTKAKACTEKVRTNCFSGGNLKIGEGGKRTLIDSKFPLPSGLDMSANDPKPKRSQYENPDENMRVRFYSAWLHSNKPRYKGKYPMEVEWGIGKGLKHENSRGPDFLRESVSSHSGDVAEMTVYSEDEIKHGNFDGWIFCAIYVWGPLSRGKWGWLLFSQPGSARFIRHSSLDDNDLVCHAEVFLP